MAINTSNSSNLQISGSSNEVNFNVLTNDFINAKITGNATVSGKVYHAWTAQIPGVGGVLEDAAYAGQGTTTQNPAVTLTYSKLATGTQVFLRKRCSDSTYGTIWEVIATTSTSGGVTSVQCTGNLLVVTYG